ncbi:MAG TPA: glutaredoxin 3 [Candidatus Binatia bacterium]
MADVTIYTTSYCPYCHAAKALLTKKNVPFTEIDVTGDSAARAELAERAGGRRTVPQVFIDGTPIGGYDDLSELERSGRLDELLRAS